jgi:hypothetical protein
VSYDRIEGFERLIERRLGIVSVQLIEIDVVGAETLERGVDCVKNVLARHALIPRLCADYAGAFRGQNELVALALQPCANDLLGTTRRRRAPPIG